MINLSNDVLGNMAATFSSLGRYEEAEPIYLKALTLSLAENGKKHDYVTTLNNLAFLYFDMGLYEQAEANWKEAILLGGQEDLLEKMHTNYADFLSSLASLYIEIGRYSEAEALLLEALAIYQQNYGKEHPSYATNSNNLAVLYYRMGQEEKAMPLYQEALRINAKLLGKEHPDYALQLSNVANAAFEMGKQEEAEQKMKEVLSIQKKALGEQHPTYAASLIALATVYQKQERFAAAGNLFWQAVGTFEKTFGKEHPKYAEALNSLANYYLDKNSIDSARLLSAAAFAANSPDENIQPSKYATLNYYSNNSSLILLNTLLSIIKKQYQITGKPELLQEQQQIAAIALDFSKRIKNSFYAEGNKLELFKTTYKYAALGIASGAKLKTKESIQNAFAFAEQNKSMLLADATKAQRARNLGDLPDSLSLKEQKLYYQLDQLKKTALAAGDSEKQAAQSQLNALNIELDAFKKLLEKNYPKYYKLKFADTKASTEAVQKLLDKKSLFLEYFVADSMLYLFILRKNDVQLLSLNISAQLLSSKTAQLRKTISDYEFIKKEEEEAYALYTETAYWFYKNTLAPAIEASKDIDNLIIVADGELGHLPFEAFLTAEVKSEMAYAKLPYLLNKYKVSYNYSASIWKENLEKKIEHKNGKMLAVAAAYKGKEDSLRTRANRAPHLRNLRDALQDLPAAKQEVEALGKVFSGDFLYGDNASENFFKEKADKYGIIHLAMHGILNQRAPILSSLAFTESGDSTEDNFLEAWEISQLRLNADLVVLSACETGYGKFQQGEGVMSLAHSFMYAGVPSLVVSMWQVNDASTSAIMQLFYKNLAKGMNKAEALQQAKLGYIKTVGVRR